MLFPYPINPHLCTELFIAKILSFNLCRDSWSKWKLTLAQNINAQHVNLQESHVALDWITNAQLLVCSNEIPHILHPNHDHLQAVMRLLRKDSGWLENDCNDGVLSKAKELWIDCKSKPSLVINTTTNTRLPNCGCAFSCKSSRTLNTTTGSCPAYCQCFVSSIKWWIENEKCHTKCKLGFC